MPSEAVRSQLPSRCHFFLAVQGRLLEMAAHAEPSTEVLLKGLPPLPSGLQEHVQPKEILIHCCSGMFRFVLETLSE